MAADGFLCPFGVEGGFDVKNGGGRMRVELLGELLES